MSWREQLVAKLLLLLARMVCDDPALALELKNLGNHISVNAPKLEAAA